MKTLGLGNPWFLPAMPTLKRVDMALAGLGLAVPTLERQALHTGEPWLPPSPSLIDEIQPQSVGVRTFSGHSESGSIRSRARRSAGFHQARSGELPKA